MSQGGGGCFKHTKLSKWFLFCLLLLFVLMKDTAAKLPVICRCLSTHLQNKMMPTAHTKQLMKACWISVRKKNTCVCRSKVYLWCDLFSKKGCPISRGVDCNHYSLLLSAKGQGVTMRNGLGPKCQCARGHSVCSRDGEAHMLSMQRPHRRRQTSRACHLSFLPFCKLVTLYSHWKSSVCLSIYDLSIRTL